MNHIPILIEIAKAIKEVKTHFQTLRQYEEATARMGRGKDPFPPPQDVQKQLDSNAALSRKLKNLQLSGVPEPQLLKVSLDELANPATKTPAKQKLRDTLVKRQAHVLALRKLLQDLSVLENEAKIKAKGAREIRDFWGEMMKAPLPDLGTLNKTTYFTYHQIFEKLSGSINSISRDCQRAIQRLTKDLTSYEKDTKTLFENFRTFGI
jgi:small-conductance mechanosensitive channel